MLVLRHWKNKYMTGSSHTLTKANILKGACNLLIAKVVDRLSATAHDHTCTCKSALNIFK